LENSGAREFAGASHPLHRIASCVSIIGEQDKILCNGLGDDLMFERVAVIGMNGKSEQFTD